MPLQELHITFLHSKGFFLKESEFFTSYQKVIDSLRAIHCDYFQTEENNSYWSIIVSEKEEHSDYNYVTIATKIRYFDDLKEKVNSLLKLMR